MSNYRLRTSDFSRFYFQLPPPAGLEDSDRLLHHTSILLKTRPRVEGGVGSSCFIGSGSDLEKRNKLLRAIRQVPICLSHTRTFENFARSNTDDRFVIPPPNGDERWKASLSRRTLFPYLLFSDGVGMKPVLLTSLAMGLFSGAWATFFYQYITWETYMTDPVAYDLGVATDVGVSDLIKQTGNKIQQLIASFKFFPSFLALGYITYALGHWRTFQTLGYSIQGILNTTAVKVGSALTKPEAEVSKQLAFRVYRYVQVIHILAYKDQNRW